MNQQEQRRQRVRQECQERGIAIRQRGKAWHLSGPGIDLLTADLANVEPSLLKPYQPRERMRG